MRKYIIISLLTFIGLSSCVSKKKFNDLAIEKIQADETIDKLNITNTKLLDRINSITDEFNSSRYLLNYSNAQKDTNIDSLSHVIQNLQSENVLLEKELKECKDNMSVKNLERQSHISELELQLNKLSNEKSSIEENLISTRTDLKFQLNKKESESNRLTDKISANEQEIEELKKEVKNQKGKASWLRKLNSKDKEEIDALKNQIEILKKNILE